MSEAMGTFVLFPPQIDLDSGVEYSLVSKQKQSASVCVSLLSNQNGHTVTHGSFSALLFHCFTLANSFVSSHFSSPHTFCQKALSRTGCVHADLKPIINYTL